uniref:Ion_trans_2 domain-containing protein n=1 Tax=Macrostomum lignano TaxID=282301 RepID=A0A1I8GJP7_9PLAT
MIYAILGIPLMLLFLTKIGEPTAVLFRGFYLNIVCCKCFIKKLPHESKNFNNQDEQSKDQQQTSWRTVEDGVVKQAPAKVSELVVVEDDEDDEEEEEEVVNIPITVTIMLLIFYILIGASVFRVWEEWTVIEGTYFSFITLSTIGFGDYVPGKDGPFNSNWIIAELLVGCVYCVFGLAMLSMCINLIQDEISAKFHWIAGKLGMSRNRNAEDDDEDEDDDDDDE